MAALNSKLQNIFFCGLQYEYGNPDLGLSYEFLNMLPALKASTFFPIDVVIRQYGKHAANERLLRSINDANPDLVFFLLHKDELLPETLLQITCPTFNWFGDDHWRFSNFSRVWAPRFTYCSTTSSDFKYREAGIHKVLESQWAANLERFFPVPGFAPAVSFVGQQRRSIDGITYLGGWQHRLSHSELLSVFSNSKININFAGKHPDWKCVPKCFLSRTFSGSYQLSNNFRATVEAYTSKQVKARIFEIAACGGFLLTEYSPDLHRYFEIGKEVETFTTTAELHRKVAYYLAHPKERHAIARAGHARTIGNHSYKDRFGQLLPALHLNLFNRTPDIGQRLNRSGGYGNAESVSSSD